MLNDFEEMDTIQQVPTIKKDSVIIAKKEKAPLILLQEAIQKISLVNTLLYKLKDPLVKYTEDGAVTVSKIPHTLYIVAIIYEIMETAKRVNLGICVKHGVIYFYSSGY